MAKFGSLRIRSIALDQRFAVPFFFFFPSIAFSLSLSNCTLRVASRIGYAVWFPLSASNVGILFSYPGQEETDRQTDRHHQVGME